MYNGFQYVSSIKSNGMQLIHLNLGDMNPGPPNPNRTPPTMVTCMHHLQTGHKGVHCISNFVYLLSKCFPFITLMY